MRNTACSFGLLACVLSVAGCDDNNAGGTPAAGSGGASAGTGTADAPINDECPKDIGPFDGPFAQKGKCCYRTANSSRIAKQTGDDRLFEYRLQYFLVTNHPDTIGAPPIPQLTIDRYNREEQSMLLRIRVPWRDGSIASGQGSIQLGVGRYNCGEGTYSFYSGRAAPVKSTLTDPTRWVTDDVPAKVDVSKGSLADQVTPIWATNMRSRVPGYTPYLKTAAPKELDWEASSQAFSIDMAPKLEGDAVDCIGSRDESVWVPGGKMQVFVRVDANHKDPIATIGGITLAQLQAFGTAMANEKDKPENDPTTAQRCMPGAGCKWRKLPESLCPATAEEQALWGCHVGWPANPDKRPTSCTQEAPTSVLDPDKGATSEGQCCDPLGAGTLPKCNGWLNLFDFVAAAAEITDVPSDQLQQNCMK